MLSPPGGDKIPTPWLASTPLTFLSRRLSSRRRRSRAERFFGIPIAIPNSFPSKARCLRKPCAASPPPWCCSTRWKRAHPDVHEMFFQVFDYCSFILFHVFEIERKVNMPCTLWDDVINGMCIRPVVKGGLCQHHIDAVNSARQSIAPVIAPVAIKWTPNEIKKSFGAITKHDGKTHSDFYYVNPAVGMHVHVYPGGVHVKIGNSAPKYLYNGKFQQEKWEEGVSLVKKRAGDQKMKLLGAMALTLAESPMPEVQASAIITALL
jgi:hypothetical protein